MIEKTLWSHEDEWLENLASHDLPAEDVKILGGGGQVADLHVVFRATLQKSFQPRAAVFRPFPPYLASFHGLAPDLQALINHHTDYECAHEQARGPLGIISGACIVAVWAAEMF